MTATQPPDDTVFFQSQLLDAIAQAVIASSPRGDIIYWNRHAEELYGWRAEEVIGLPTVEVLSPPSSRQQMERVCELVRGGQPWSGEFTMRRRDGTTFQAAVTDSPVNDRNGRLVALLGISKDITEAIAARNELTGKEIQLATAQALTHVGSWEWNVVTGALTWSDQMYRLFGFNPGEISPRYEDWLSLLHPDDREEAHQIALNALENPGRVSFEVRTVRRDGAVRMLHLIGEVVTDERGQPVRGFGAAQDVTDARKAEEELRESELRFRQIAENVDQILWMRDAETRRVLYVSPAFERIWGLPRSVLLAESEAWQKCIHPADAERIWNAVEAFPGDRDETFRIIRGDGSMRWIRDRAFAIRNQRGVVVRFAGIAEDITAAKTAELKVQEKSEQLQRLSQRLLEVQEAERRHLARELHDEVGQMLTAAKINLQAAEQAAAGLPVAEQLARSVASMDALLSQVRRMSLDLRPPMLDDLGLLPALRWYVDQIAGRTGLEIRFCPQGEIPRLEGSIETAAFRVAQEALTNVVRHAQARCAHVEISANGRLQVIVSDDGVGFDFERVQREGQHGLTAGVPGMLERVELAGGSIAIESAPGSGTEVRATFPLTRRE